MADEDAQPIVASDDDEDEKKQPAGPPEDKAYQAAITPMPAPAIQHVASQAPVTPTPTITAPLPGAAPPAAGPQPLSPGDAAVQRLSKVQQENPFAMLMAKESNIHNPFLRILAKSATAIGAGAEGLSKEYPAIEQERIAEANQPAQAAGVTSENALRGAQVAGMPSEINLRNQQAAHEQAETAAAGRPKLLTGEGNTQWDKTTGDPVARQYENPDGSTQWVAEGQAPQWPIRSPETGVQPTGGTQGGFMPPAAGPAGPQASVASPQRVAGPAGPQVPVAGPQGVTYKPPAVATPEEAAKLAPVGADADTYNHQIADLLGKKASDFAVKPADSRERADKILADAKAQDEAERGKQSEARGAQAQNREQQQQDVKPVQAMDPKTDQMVITSMGDALKRGLQNPIEANSTDINNAKATLTNVNLMENAIKGMKENLTDFDALTQQDKNILTEFLNSRDMVPPGGALSYISGTISSAANSFVQSEKYQTLTDPAKNILQNIVNLRESSLGLGKLETGGSRAMQSAIDAINKVIPGAFISDSKTAEKQLRDFAGRLDEIKADSPIIRGQSFRDNPFSEAKAGGKTAPKIGTIEDGYRFNGGNPADKKNWEKQ